MELGRIGWCTNGKKRKAQLADHLRDHSADTRKNWTLLFRVRGVRPGCDISVERIVRMAMRDSLSIDTIPGPEKDRRTVTCPL
jgi:hypothetical protein